MGSKFTLKLSFMHKMLVHCPKLISKIEDVFTSEFILFYFKFKYLIKIVSTKRNVSM